MARGGRDPATGSRAPDLWPIHVWRRLQAPTIHRGPYLARSPGGWAREPLLLCSRIEGPDRERPLLPVGGTPPHRPDLPQHQQVTMPAQVNPRSTMIWKGGPTRPRPFQADWVPRPLREIAPGRPSQRQVRPSAGGPSWHPAPPTPDRHSETGPVPHGRLLPVRNDRHPGEEPFQTHWSHHRVGP